MAAVKTKSLKSQFAGRFVPREADHLLASIGRYTRFVLLSKFFLIFLASALITGVILFPLLNDDQEGLRIAFDASVVSDKSEAVPHMVNPRFQGFDNDNQPYTVTAETAIQNEDNHIIMQKINADIFLNNKAWLALTSEKGSLDTEAKMLLLSGDVTLFHDEGYEFKTPEVEVFMADGRAVGQAAVEGQGPFGTLKATGFTINDRGKQLLFAGPVALTIHKAPADSVKQNSHKKR